MTGYAWMAISAMMTMAGGVAVAVFGAMTENWLMMAFAGVLTLAGVGMAMLSLRE